MLRERSHRALHAALEVPANYYITRNVALVKVRVHPEGVRVGDVNLKNLTFPGTGIKIPNGSFTVRGVSLEAITILANTYGPRSGNNFRKVVRGSYQIDTMDGIKSLIDGAKNKRLTYKELVA